MNSALEKANAKAKELEELITLYIMEKCAKCPDINNLERCSECEDIDYVRASNALDFLNMVMQSLEPLF